jgi:hypothetical protein
MDEPMGEEEINPQTVSKILCHNGQRQIGYCNIILNLKLSKAIILQYKEFTLGFPKYARDLS